MSPRPGKTSMLHISPTTRAVLEKVHEAKQIQRWTHHHSDPTPSELSSRPPPDSRQTHTWSPVAKSVLLEAEVSNDTSFIDTTGFAVSSWTGSSPRMSSTPTSPVSVVPPVPHAKPVMPTDLLPLQRVPIAATEEKEPNTSAVVRVEYVVQAAKAAHRIQEAWKKHKQRQGQRSARSRQNDDDTGSRSEDANTENNPDQSNSRGDESLLPRPPISAKKVGVHPARVNEAAVQVVPDQVLAEMSGRDGDDSSSADRWSSENTDHCAATALQQPLRSSWMEDEWTFLEEGRYLGDLKGTLDGQSTPSNSFEDFLIWKQPQQLIQLRERQRLAACQQRQWGRVSASKAIENGSEQTVDIVPIVSPNSKEPGNDDRVDNLATASAVPDASRPGTKARQIPLPKVRLRHKKHNVRVLLRRKARQTDNAAQPASSILESWLAVDCKRQEKSEASEENAPSSKVVDLVEETAEREKGNAANPPPAHTYVFFSSPAEEEDSEAIAPARNDLISIGDLTVAGGLLRTVTESAAPVRDEPSAHGFIRLESIPTGTPLRSPGSESDPQAFSGDGSVDGGDFGDAADLKHDSGVSYADGDIEASPQAPFPETSSVTRQQIIDVLSEDDRASLNGNIGPIRPCNSETQELELHELDQERDNAVDSFAGSTGATGGSGGSVALLKRMGGEASARVQRIRQRCARNAQFDQLVSTNTLQSPRVRTPTTIDGAKQQEFRQILDEFKESLQQASASSSFAASLPKSSASADETETLALGSSVAENPRNAKREQDTVEEGADDEVDEELQAMLQEISRFKRQFEQVMKGVPP